MDWFEFILGPLYSLLLIYSISQYQRLLKYNIKYKFFKDFTHACNIVWFNSPPAPPISSSCILLPSLITGIVLLWLCILDFLPTSVALNITCLLNAHTTKQLICTHRCISTVYSTSQIWSWRAEGKSDLPMNLMDCVLSTLSPPLLMVSLIILTV